MKFFILFITLLQLSLSAQIQPSYKIWSVLSNHNINLGDTVIFDIGLSGYGNINPKFLKFTLYSDPTAKMFYTKNTLPLKQTIGPYEILIVSEFSNSLSFLFKTNVSLKSSIVLPTDNIRITINSHIKTVPSEPGDKSIKIIASYSSDGLLWYTEEAFLNFHVNTYYEEHQMLLNSIGLFLAFIALIKPSIFIRPFQKLINIIRQSLA